MERVDDARQQEGEPDLAAAITACAGELTQKVVAEFYKDPFWDARFGARGRRHTEEDGRYHLSYLAQALQGEGDPEVLLNYAVWLRSVLVSRGMCSRHLAENFERLANALREKPWRGIERSVDYMQRAADALRYGEGPAALLQKNIPEVVKRAVATLRQQQAMEVWCRQELEYFLSYLADALATSRPELFIKHVEWSRGFFEGLKDLDGVKRPQVIALLGAIQTAIGSLGLPELSGQTDPIVGAARAGLVARQA